MKKIGLFCLALVLALGLMGGAYALWSDQLYIQGNVDTGNLCWEWYQAPLNTDPGPPGVASVPDKNIAPGFAGSWYWAPGYKDVGWTTTSWDDPQNCTITLNNVYPCYFEMFSVYFRNCGTLPLHFERAIFTSPYDTGFIFLYKNEEGSLDLDGDTYDDIEFKWGNHIGTQYHPDEESGEVSFWVHVLQEAPQGQTGLTFTITFEAVQYNESMWP
jgi:hypothetical protein